MIKSEDIIQEWEITSIYDFINQFKIQDWINKKYPDEPESCVESKYFLSDEDTIKDWLEESDEYYSIDFIDDRRNDGYWVIKQIYETKINDKGGDFEDKIRNRIIRMVDNYVDELIDIQFKPLIDNDCEITEDNKYDIESIFMSYRNVIAGTEWDGRRREYEKYNK